jgi:hypothetical protein
MMYSYPVSKKWIMQKMELTAFWQVRDSVCRATGLSESEVKRRRLFYPKELRQIEAELSLEPKKRKAEIEDAFGCKMPRIWSVLADATGLWVSTVKKRGIFTGREVRLIENYTGVHIQDRGDIEQS